MKKVLLACTVGDVKSYCLERYISAIKKLTYPNYDILLVDNSETEDYAKKIASYGIPVARTKHCKLQAESVAVGLNFIREKILKENYDYFFCLEQDVIPPPNIIELLLESKKDIVTGLARHLFIKENNEVFEIALIGINDVNNPGKYVYIDWDSTKKYKAGIIKVDYCAMTCLLISREVLEKIRFRFEITEQTKDNPNNLKWQDICFCEDAESLGFEIFANLAAKCSHLFYGGFSVTLGDTTRIILKEDIN